MNLTWRLMHSPALSGAANMALDEALAESVLAGGPPVFRTYTWDQPTISLGRFQDPLADLGPQTISQELSPLVRRMTGGGAIYHAKELTYSLVCRQEDLGARSVKESFKLLCAFLIETYRQLGLAADFAIDAFPLAAESGELGKKTPFCFAGRELYDIVIDGRKLGGNAQRRLQKVIFQHGSIPLLLEWPQLERRFRADTLPDREQITDLSGWVNGRDWRVAAGELAELVTLNFSASLGLKWQKSAPDERELSRVQELILLKYGSKEWTLAASNL